MTRSYVEPLPTPAAALLELARLKAGLSQSRLAERAGVPTTMVSAYERGRRQPTLPTLQRMLTAAGFELRMHLAPRDPHDDVLATLEARRSPAERGARDREIAAWRNATPVARRATDRRRK